jgi:hypothetical protein
LLLEQPDESGDYRTARTKLQLLIEDLVEDIEGSEMLKISNVMR